MRSCKIMKKIFFLLCVFTMLTLASCGFLFGNDYELCITNLQDSYEIDEVYFLYTKLLINGKENHTTTNTKDFSFDIIENNCGAKIEWVKVSDREYEIGISSPNPGKFVVDISYKNFNEVLGKEEVGSTGPLTFNFAPPVDIPINFYNYDGTLITTNYYDYGQVIDFPIVNDESGYILVGWADDYGEIYTTDVLCKKDTNFTAIFSYIDEGTEGIIYEFKEDTNTYKVVGYEGFYPDIVIPTYHNDKMVDEIANQAFESRAITSVKLPATIRSIGKRAFYGSKINKLVLDRYTVLSSIGSYAFYKSSLTSLDLGNTCLETVGDYAFALDTSLEYVHFPETLTKIGEEAFEDDGKAIVLFQSYDTYKISLGSYWYGGLYNYDEIVGYYTNVKEVKENDNYRYFITNDNYVGIMKYMNESSLLSIDLNTVEGIEVRYVCSQAFKNSNITDVILGKELMYIGDYAFYSCKNLNYVDYSESSKVEIVGDFAFARDTSLKYVHLPATLTKIGEEAFEDDGKAIVLFQSYDTSKISLGSYWYGGLYNYDEIVGYYTNVKEVKENGNYRYFITDDDYVGIMKYMNGSSLLSIELSEVDGRDIMYVCNQAFAFAEITDVTLGKQLRYIGDYAFYKCEKLKYVDYNESSKVEIVGDFAFALDTSLKYVHLPATLTKIGKEAFEDDGKAIVLFQSFDMGKISLGSYWYGGLYNYDEIVGYYTNVKEVVLYTNGQLKGYITNTGEEIMF